MTQTAATTAQAENPISIIYPTRKSDYALHYDRQIYQQPGGIEIDPEERTLGVFVNAEINAIPMDVYHNRRIWIGIGDPENTPVKAMHELLKKIAPLAQRICDGYDCDWDGNNFRGHLNQDARAAMDDLQYEIDAFSGILFD